MPKDLEQEIAYQLKWYINTIEQENKLIAARTNLELFNAFPRHQRRLPGQTAENHLNYYLWIRQLAAARRRLRKHRGLNPRQMTRITNYANYKGIKPLLLAVEREIHPPVLAPKNNTPNYVTYLKKEALMNAINKNNNNKKKRLEILKANMLPVKLPKNATNHFNLTNFKVGNVAYRVGHKINNKNFYMYFKPTSFKNWWGDPFNKNLKMNEPISNKPHVLTGKPILRKNVVKVKFF